ncbi:MAG TPA: hypothetical protein DHU96_29595 [Actinobacteria bacterium]|nr:hypothetical protein [Actinomycetota bacterium]
MPEVRVEVGRFEEWQPGDRRFGLAYAAQAWHWIDPERGRDRVYAALAPGGAVALFWMARSLKGAQKITAHALLGFVILQITLSILTLLNQVPIPLAALHQITAVALFTTAIWHAYEVSGTSGTGLAPAGTP